MTRFTRLACLIPLLLNVAARAQSRAPIPAPSASPPVEQVKDVQKGILRARFVDEKGAPIAGIELVWRPDGATKDEVLAKSGADGVSTASIARKWETDAHYISVWTNGRGRATAQFNPKLDPLIMADLGTVTLGPGGTVSGFVRDSAGRALQGTSIEVRATALDELDFTPAVDRLPGTGDSTAFAISNADGSYRVEGAPVGSISIWAHHDSCFRQGRARVHVNADKETGRIDFNLEPLPPERIIEGRVLAPDGTPFVGAAVDTSVSDPTQQHYDMGVSIGCWATTDDKGRFRLYLPLPTDETLGITAKDRTGRFSDGSTGAVAGARDVVIQLVAQHAVVVFVHDAAGHPIELYGWSLVVSDPWMLSGERVEKRPGGRGQFTIPVSQFTIEVEAPGFETSKELGPYRSDAAPDPIDVTLSPLCTARGSVVFEGKPVSGATVELLAPASDRSHEIIDLVPGFDPATFEVFSDGKGVTDADGNFAIPIGNPKMWCHVRAWKQGCAESAVTSIQVDADPVRIELRKQAVIRGTVKVAAGVHPEEMQLELCRQPKDIFESDDERSPVFRTKPAPDGSYRFDSLAPGCWLLFVHGPQAADASFHAADDAPPFLVTVKDGVTEQFDLELAQESRATVDGLFAVDGKPVIEGSVYLFGLGTPCVEVARAFTSDDGKFEIAVRQPGTYRLMFQSRADTEDPKGHFNDTALDVITLGSARTEWHRSTDAATWKSGGVVFSFH